MALALARSALAQQTPSTQFPAVGSQTYQTPAPPVSEPPHGGGPIRVVPPTLEIPGNQQAPQSAPTPAPYAILPLPQPAPTRAPLAVLPAPQPVLPAVFRGCWTGNVAELEWIRREPGAHKVGFWTPKTYRLCYRRVGNGPFALTFTETGVEPSEKIINPHGRVDPIATDGRAWAKMRAMLHFDEYPVGRDADTDTFSVDEVTDLDCRIVAGEMTVSASVHGTRDGAPWFTAHWRAPFTQVMN